METFNQERSNDLQSSRNLPVNKISFITRLYKLRFAIATFGAYCIWYIHVSKASPIYKYKVLGDINSFDKLYNFFSDDTLIILLSLLLIVILPCLVTWRLRGSFIRIIFIFVAYTLLLCGVFIALFQESFRGNSGFILLLVPFISMAMLLIIIIRSYLKRNEILGKVEEEEVEELVVSGVLQSTIRILILLGILLLISQAFIYYGNARNQKNAARYTIIEDSSKRAFNSGNCEQVVVDFLEGSWKKTPDDCYMATAIRNRDKSLCSKTVSGRSVEERMVQYCYRTIDEALNGYAPGSQP